MVEISYKEYLEEANLAGNSLAEVRKMYKSELGLPDRAKAVLNGEPVSKDLEATTFLNDDDILSFEVESRRRAPALILGSFLIALAITGAMFVYTYTVATQTITINAATADFASISANSSPTAINLVGNVKGAIGAATLFDVVGDASYSGDIEIVVSLTNADELVEDFRFWMLRLEYVDSSNTTADLEGITKVISLANPSTSFAVDSANISGGTFFIRTPGGNYQTKPFILGSAGNDPIILAEVIQASAQ